MSELSYLDFDLSIEGGEGVYRARVLSSPAGEALSEFAQPFGALELENFFLRIGRPRRGARSLDSPEMQAAKDMGARLFERVFKDEVGACFRSSLNQARLQGQGLRLRLRVSAAELNELPWEYLYNPNRRQFLSWSVHTPIVRYLEAPQPPRALAVQPPLRLLAVIASPRGEDCTPLDVEGEWRRLQEALAPLEQRGRLVLERLERATLGALQRRLRGEAVHILHFVGHGRFDQAHQDGLLLFESEDGRGRPVSGQFLGAILCDHDPLRLAVLNACEGARTDRLDPFAGVAQSLILQGLPAVVAMQFEITDRAAVTFAGEFYSALADGYPVDASLAEARKAIFAQGNDIEWGTPVYFTRASDGRVFTLEEASTLEPGSPAAPDLLARARGRQEAARQLEEQPSIGRLGWARRIPNRFWITGAGALALTILVVLGIVFGGRGVLLSVSTQTLTIEETPKVAILSADTPSPDPMETFTPRPTLAPIDTMVSDVDGMTLVYVPQGEFLMGSDDADPYAEEDEKPQHTVYLDAFWIDQHEVTNQQFADFLNERGNQEVGGFTWLDTDASSVHITETSGVWQVEPGYGDHPVVHVTWSGAQAYCDWAGKRLPTEAEWEKAARGGLEGALYPWGDEAPICEPDVANGAQYNKCGKRTIPVGSYGPNGYGLFDMAGNVWEWISDWYAENYYAYSPLDNPRGSEYGGLEHVLRGGSWDEGANDLRVAARNSGIRDFSLANIGFRCARSAEAMDVPPTEQPVPADTPTSVSTLAPGATMISDVDGMTLVYVPQGEFRMGSDDADPHAEEDEKPQHTVYLDAFWIDQTEVTNAMYAMCVDAGGCDPLDETSSNTRDSYFGNPEYGSYPVIWIAWNDAQSYCQWAGRRLPTEAEWEKAARGTDGRMYPWGNGIDCTLANYKGREGVCVGDTTEVGSYPQGASLYGVMDMAGNVYEWVADWYAEDYYASSPAENPTGSLSRVKRVLRGGSWVNDENYLRVADRFGGIPAATLSGIGFRCARSP